MNQKGSIALWVIGGIGAVLALAVVGTAMNLITIPWLKLNSQIQTNRDIVTKTYNAENALYNYRWFKDRAEAIKATEAKVKLAAQAEADFTADAGPRDKWTFEDKTESARMRTITLGLKAQYEDLVHEYNSRASQVDRAIFKDDLPLFFSLEAF